MCMSHQWQGIARPTMKPGTPVLLPKLVGKQSIVLEFRLEIFKSQPTFHVRDTESKFETCPIWEVDCLIWPEENAFQSPVGKIQVE